MMLKEKIAMDKCNATLENQNKIVSSAEEAIDFNFNESPDTGFDQKDDLGVPFLHKLSRPILPGDLFLFEGNILRNAISFRIDFLSDDHDIVFHINPRLDQNYIARNSFVEGKWGREEGCAIARSPIERGRPFQLQVFVLENEYLVCVNGQHMFQFSHRIPSIEVSRIEVYGDIELGNVSLLRSGIYPHPARERFKKSENSLEIPMSRFIKHGLGTCGKILIKGRVKLLPLAFLINIQSSDLVYPHPKIVYHLNVRYSFDGYVVQNSWGLRGEVWDEEIRSPLPQAFSPGKPFTLSITSNNSHIQAGGPGWDLPPFYHRLDPDKGHYVYIQGDIVLNSLQILPDSNTESVF